MSDRWTNISTYRAAYTDRDDADRAAGELRDEGHEAVVLDAQDYTDEPHPARWVVVDERNLPAN